jgi:hypothetical protein
VSCNNLNNLERKQVAADVAMHGHCDGLLYTPSHCLLPSLQVDLSDILAGTPEMGLPASTSMAAKGAVSQQPGLSSPANVDGGSAGGPPLRLKLGRDEMRELMRSASIAKS